MASRLKKSAAAGALVVALVGGFEGVRTVAYKDIVGVPTVCYGETQGVKMGDKYTLAQCKDMLKSSLDKYALAVEACIHKPMTDKQYASFVSLAYNVGTGGFCKSTTAKLFNEGKVVEACDAMLRWNKAGGRPVAGLTNRRKAERELCLNH